MTSSTIIIPTLNEEKNIKKLLATLQKQYTKTPIIVVDDGSTDNTVSIIKSFKNVTLINRKNKRTKGLTVSILDGAKRVKTKQFIIMDGDLQHPPHIVQKIKHKLKNADLVIGTRKKITEKWAFHRKVMSKGALLLAKMRLPVRCNDPISGFFGIKTELFNTIVQKHQHKFALTGYKILFEILKYVPKDTIIGEVPYRFNMRNNGESKIGAKQIAAFVKSLIR